MKKIIVLFFVAILFLGARSLWAEEMGGMKGDGMGMMKDGGMGKENMMMGGKMMMHARMNKSIVATSDGGIVVMSGNKLTKYDKNLKVIKEVELATDMEGMQKMMTEMGKMCPMMGKGMMGDNLKEDKDGEEKSEHESHH